MRNDVATRFTRAVRIRLILFLVTLIALPTGLVLAAPASAHPEHSFTALVFSKTAGFRHGSIPAGIAAIQKLATEHEFTVEVTEDGAAFTDENLARFDVVIWLSTTGDVLNTDQQAAFERYVRDGGGYAGVHAASDTEYDWPWYGDLVGAYFKNHPQQQDATVKIEDPAHPSTADLAPTWDRFDEWYNYRTNPRGDLHVLASLDETSYSGGEMGSEHPISWCQDYDGGRSWYTGMGHTDESFSDPSFLTHLLGGIRTAAGVEKADCAATLTGSFEKVTLDDNTANPMDLAVAEDGRVLYADRKGEVKLIQPNGNVSVAGRVDVYTGQEFGLLGIALDPQFATTHHVYLYYSPAGTRRWTGSVASPWTVTASIRTRRKWCSPWTCNARSAAMPAARWSSTTTATSTSPPGTTPTRSRPPDSPRSTSSPAGPPGTRSGPRPTPGA